MIHPGQTMNQKYLISKSMEENKLIIKEFKKKKKNDDYSLTYEGTYDGKTIMSAISKGKNALILTLRTTSFYPTDVYVRKIAEACIDLCSPEKDASIEPFFNDTESIKT
ncbi:MAG: hypothetical protein JRF25_12325, partial [Deltaproteobacteria bacterium]|nr:hypothetical protein [Deltaproteobacteria bacterium]